MKTLSGCNGLYDVVSDPGVLVKVVEHKLKMNSSDYRFANITSHTLETSFKMFTYLYVCPFFQIKSAAPKGLDKWFQLWSTFYREVFQNQSPDQIILTLNRMMKKRDNRIIAQKIFQKTARLLSLKYEQIQSIFPGKTKNVSFIEEQKTVKLLDTEGIL